MSFLKKVNTNLARAKQMAMVKIGQSDATVDPQFNQLEGQFKEQYSKMKKLGKYVQNYQAAVKDLGHAQKGMAQTIMEQYNENFHVPLTQYLGQYKIIEERIVERNTRLVDMDRYNADLKVLMSKPDTDPTRLQILKEKAEYKSREYNSLNEELIRDIPALLRDHSRFFDGLFANVVQGKAVYMMETARAMGLLTPNFQNVDKSAPAN